MSTYHKTQDLDQAYLIRKMANTSIEGEGEGIRWLPSVEMLSMTDYNLCAYEHEDMIL